MELLNLSGFIYLKQLKSLGIFGIVTKMSIAGNSEWKYIKIK